MSGKVFRTIVFILFCILIAVILAIFLFGFMKGYSTNYIIKKLIPGTVEGIYKAIDIREHDGYEGFRAYTDGEKVYMLEGSELAVYDRSGKDVSYISLEYTEPAVSEGFGRLLAYDMATGDFIVVESGKTTGSGSVDGKVLGAYLPDDEHIGFVLASGSGFRGRFVLLDKDFEATAEYSYSDRYPVSGCISYNGRRIAVAGIPENDSSSTKIDVFEKGSKEPESGRNMDVLAPLLLSFERDSFAACGSGTVSVLSFDGSYIKTLDMENMVLAEGTQHGLVIVTSDTGKDILHMIDSQGNISWSGDIPAGTRGVSYTGEHIFYWNNTEAGAFYKNGTVIDLTGETGSVKSVLPLGEYTVAIVTDSNIILYEFN